MKILLDQGTPVPLRQFLDGHTVLTAYELGWSTMKDGEWLRAAEREGVEVLVTTDSHLKHQQNLKACRIAIVMLLSTSWPHIRNRTAEIVKAMEGLGPGGYIKISV